MDVESNNFEKEEYRIENNNLYLSRRNLGLLHLPLKNHWECVWLLDLSCNKLPDLDNDLFISLPELRRLRLEGNLLKSLPSSIGNCAKLELLSLGNEFTGNFIMKLPSELQNLHSLRFFYGSRNCFKEFPLGLLPCQQLEIIKLDRNQIHSLPPFLNLKVLERLEEVNLAQNILLKLDSQAIWPSNLKILDLSDNRIGEIHETFISGLPDSTVILLSGNDVNNTPPIMDIQEQIQPQLDYSAQNYPKLRKPRKFSQVGDPHKLLEQAARSTILYGNEIPSQPIQPTFINKYLAKPPKLCATCPLRFYRGFPMSLPLALYDGKSIEQPNNIVKKLTGYPNINYITSVCSPTCRERCRTLLRYLTDAKDGSIQLLPFDLVDL